MKFALLFLLSAFSIACSTTDCAHRKSSTLNEGGATSQTAAAGKMTLDKSQLKIKVAKPDGSLQCNRGKKISPEEMKKELKDITIYSSFSSSDGMMRIQVCGAATGQFNVYEISESDLEKALSYGFERWNR